MYEIITKSIFGEESHQTNDIADKYVSLLNGLINNRLHNHDLPVNNNNEKGTKSKFKSLVRDLLNNKNKNKDNHTDKNITRFDPYILSIFDSFCASKQELVINYHRLSENEQIIGLIMYKISETVWNGRQRGKKDTTNLFRPEFVNIFTRLKHIILITKSMHDSFAVTRSLSMEMLLSKLKLVNIKSLRTIKVLSSNADADPFKGTEAFITNTGYERDDWMKSLWRSSSSILKKKYGKENYQIQWRDETSLMEDEYRGFIIERK